MNESYRLTEKEFDSVTQLDGPARFKHFVSRVADWQKVWGLRSDSGWVSVGYDDGNSGFPVWPHPQYAAACATGEWAENRPASIDVHEFVESWLLNMTDDGVKVAVFPTPKMRGVFVEARGLQRMLQDELEQYE
ncbi:MAG TPA: DUF2750 domain-containing protein [Noviherbaspirillum sp.]|nr:DUF2750 domain-containing protein [Noviherbaspirillum sp.]